MASLYPFCIPPVSKSLLISFIRICYYKVIYNNILIFELKYFFDQESLREELRNRSEIFDCFGVIISQGFLCSKLSSV